MTPKPPDGSTMGLSAAQRMAAQRMIIGANTFHQVQAQLQAGKGPPGPPPGAPPVNMARPPGLNIPYSGEVQIFYLF